MNLGGTFDLQVDPAEADRRKRTRLVQLNTQVVPRLRLLGFIFVACCALLHNAFVYPGLDGEMLPLALVVVILGGSGSLLGSFVGSFIVGFLYNFGQAMFPELAYVVLFLPMLIVLVVRPQGLFGRQAV